MPFKIRINGVELDVPPGSTCSIRNNVIFINGQRWDSAGNGEWKRSVNLVVEGDPVSVQADGAVEINGDVAGNVDAGNGLVVTGNVGGSAKAGSSLSCGDVGGDVKAGNSVRCGAVKGSVKAAGNVTQVKS